MARIRNANLESFGTPTADVAAITNYTFWIGAERLLSVPNTGTGDQTPNIGQEMRIPVNMLNWLFAPGDFDDAGLVMLLRNGLSNTTIRVGAHTGSPGAAAANEVAGAWYSRATLAAASSEWNVTEATS